MRGEENSKSTKALREHTKKTEEKKIKFGCQKYWKKKQIYIYKKGRCTNLTLDIYVKYGEEKCRRAVSCLPHLQRVKPISLLDKY